MIYEKEEERESTFDFREETIAKDEEKQHNDVNGKKDYIDSYLWSGRREGAISDEVKEHDEYANSEGSS